MAKKKSAAEPEKNTDVQTNPSSDAEKTELDAFMQQLADTVSKIPAPDTDPADPKQQTAAAANTEEPIIVSSIFHTTNIIDDPLPELTVPAAAEPAAAEPVTETPAEDAPQTEAAVTEAPTAVQETEPAAQTAEPSALSEEEKAAVRRDNAEFSMIDESTNNPFRNVFVDSLSSVTADDLGTPPKKKKKDPIDIVIECFRRAIFWAAVVAFFVSGYQIVSKLYSYRESEKIYDFDNIFEALERREDLVATAVPSGRLSTLTPVNGTREESDELNNSANSSQYNEKLLIMQGQLQLLRNQKNKEIMGWIEMPGDTAINYPVVQGEDNDYYLHYAYDGAYNPAGSIYLDYRNQTAMSTNRHAIIYGHNMESGTPMFSNLLHFKDESYWKNNRYINIYTDEALYTYEVFAAYETPPQQAGVENNSWRMNFQKDESVFLAWVDSVKARSDIHPNVPVDGDGRILTLSTCMNINDNRYVVHAVLVEVVKQ